MASIEERIEDSTKQQLREFGIPYYTKTESINSDIDSALAKYPSKSGGSGKIALTAGVKGVSSLEAGARVKQVAQILGGNGGGRDDFATAGGKITDPSKIKEA